MFRLQENKSGATRKKVARKRDIISVVTQVRMLAIAENRLAFVIGAIIGCFVPISVFALTTHVMGEHHSIKLAWKNADHRLLLGLIAAGGLFSAKSVYGWGLSAFAQDRWKAVGYCILIEGVMVLSPLNWLRWVAMGFLVLINMIATGSNLMEVKEVPTLKERRRLKIVKSLKRGKSKEDIALEHGKSVRTIDRWLEGHDD